MRKNILLSLRNITRHLTEKNKIILLDYKIILSIIILLNLFSIFPINSISNTSALEYSNDTNLEFTFNPTLSLSLSGNLVIDNLIPGSSSDSNVIDVNVSTNNVSGYSLSATVGSSNNITTNLTNTSNSNYVFTSLNANDSLVSLTTDNTWGYSYSVDNDTTWSNYSGLPLYTSTPTSLFNIYNPSENTINFKIGAKASSSQPSGEYTNTINFIAVGNPEVRYYMQEFTKDLCMELAANEDYIVYDSRDNSDYSVRYINNNCWMTQNLRITHTFGYPEGTILANGSNFTNNRIVFDGTLSSDGGSYIDAYYQTPTNVNTEATGLPLEQLGVWYNYCAASAKTICKNSISQDAEEDICPSGWHLPSYRKGQFPPPINSLHTGSYTGKNYGNTDSVSWWSSDHYNETIMISFYNWRDDNKIYSSDGNPRWVGFSIRCVRSS